MARLHVDVMVRRGIYSRAYFKMKHHVALVSPLTKSEATRLIVATVNNRQHHPSCRQSRYVEDP